MSGVLSGARAGVARMLALAVRAVRMLVLVVRAVRVLVLVVRAVRATPLRFPLPAA